MQIIGEYKLGTGGANPLSSAGNVAWGQSFNANENGNLYSVAFKIYNSSGVGNAYAKIYTHTGTFGTSSKPSQLLATSLPVDVETMQADSEGFVEFLFDDYFKFTKDQKYVVVIHFTGTGTLYIRSDTSVITADGNPCYSTNLTTWSSTTTQEKHFRVLGRVVKKNKRYKYDIYDNSGAYITTWSDVISEPSFSSSVNGGLGELKVKLARLADDFGESDDITFRNQVVVRCFDSDTNDGVIIFNGWISGYTPDLSENKEYIEVVILGYVQELSRVELLDNGSGINDTPTAGNTTLTYTTKDPSNILKDIVDKYNALSGALGKINYATGSVDLTGTTISYTFKTVTIKDAIDKLIEMCPVGWYWYLDADNVIHMHEFADTPEHTFYVKKDIKEIKPYKRIENVKNVAYVIGAEVSGENLFRKYERAESISAYGRSVIFIEDGRLTDSGTMQKFADASLGADDEPEIRTQLIVIDNNNSGDFGKDIENILPGQVIKVLNFLSKKTYTLWGQALWDVDKWGYDIANVTATNVNVVKVDYTPDYVKLEVSSKLPFFTRTVNELRRRLDAKTATNNPVAPTV
jgi:hypothetical protein